MTSLNPTQQATLRELADPQSRVARDGIIYAYNGVRYTTAAALVRLGHAEWTHHKVTRDARYVRSDKWVLDWGIRLAARGA
jgi:hypothetical protein